MASGAVRNLERVAEGHGGDARHEGLHFSDSDVYKTLEAAAWDGVRGASDGVEQFIDEVSATLGRAQREDGYLNSWFQGQHPELIWKDLRWGHELYCAGHLLQAVVAFERTRSRPELSTVANKLVDHLLKTFSLEDGDGRLVGLCGHPEVETALVEFYRLTGDMRALEPGQEVCRAPRQARCAIAGIRAARAAVLSRCRTSCTTCRSGSGNRLRVMLCASCTCRRAW